MKKESTAARLNYIIQERALKQIDILNACVPFCQLYDVKMNKSDISQYVSGKVEPNQGKLFILGSALGVSEAWLMGFDVPMERISNASQNPMPEILEYYEELNDIGKHEATKRVKELTYLPEYSTFSLKAAHNDNINDKGELDKINNDMNKLKRPN